MVGTMVERVSDALNEVNERLCWISLSTEVADALARAAIEAMRVPTPHMIDAGGNALLEAGPSVDLPRTSAPDAILAWQAMIDAALSETDEPPDLQESARV